MTVVKKKKIPKPVARTRTGKASSDPHRKHYHADLKRKAVKQGRCRQCFQKRGKNSPSKVRCAACYRRHRDQMKKYRHDRVSQSVVKTRAAREKTARPVRPVRPVPIAKTVKKGNPVKKKAALKTAPKTPKKAPRPTRAATETPAAVVPFTPSPATISA